jgi:Predicted transcriptional regulators
MFIKLKEDSFKRIMLIKGFTQRGLAKAAKISDTTMNHVVNGLRNPGPKTAKKLCSALECEFEDIFFIEEDNKSYQTNTA